MLGPEIAALRVTEAGDGFHARFSAVARHYRYLILNREAPDPFLAARTWHVTTPLDAAAMDAAASTLAGEHDFASFCRRTGDASTIRTVHWARWRRDGDLVELSIAASSFCHQMVRSIAAFCVDVGRGRKAASDTASVLEGRDRHRASGAAPAHGLTLVAVAYDDEPISPPRWLDPTT
jgi:tRNA pseudouridine38-40 synthase